MRLPSNPILCQVLVFFSVSAATLPAQSSDQPLRLNHVESAACLDAAMSRLGINLDMETSPELLTDVLTHDMYLADLPRVRALVQESLYAPEPLRPMLEQIRASILEKHPAISEFVCKALARNLITKGTNNRLVIRTIHHTFLLDKLIGNMYDDYTFMIEVGNHFKKKRVELGARTDFVGSAIDMVKATGDAFFVAKAKTIDGVFQRLEHIRSANRLKESEVFGSKLCLILNISEAVVTDNLEGRRNNALVGLGLSLNPLETVTLEGEERVLRYKLSQEWTSLYETWNLAFITGKMDNLHVLYPKLLIPRVIDAPANEYLFNRTLALYTGINFHLLSELAKKPALKLPRSQELAQLWGEVNLAYGKEYFRADSGFELDSFKGRLQAGFLKTGQEIFKIIQNPLVGVPRVCI